MDDPRARCAKKVRRAHGALTDDAHVSQVLPALWASEPHDKFSHGLQTVIEIPPESCTMHWLLGSELVYVILGQSFPMADEIRSKNNIFILRRVLRR